MICLYLNNMNCDVNFKGAKESVTLLNVINDKTKEQLSPLFGLEYDIFLNFEQIF